MGGLSCPLFSKSKQSLDKILICYDVTVKYSKKIMIVLIYKYTTLVFGFGKMHLFIRAKRIYKY